MQLLLLTEIRLLTAHAQSHYNAIVDFTAEFLWMRRDPSAKVHGAMNACVLI